MPPLPSLAGVFRSALRSGVLATIVLVGVVATFTLCRLIYNVFFHPLSKYPGPKLWAASRLPLTYYSLQGKATHSIARLHERYGPVVRIAPDELSYTSGGIWKAAYGHRASEMQKPSDGRSYLPSVNNKATIFNANRKDHQRFRHSIAHAFSERALRDQESYIQRYVNLLVTRLREHSVTGPQNMVAWFNWTTFDIIGDLAFGEPFGCLEKSYYHPWVALIFKNVQYLPWGQMGHFYGIPWITKLITPRDLISARLKIFDFARSRVEARLASGGERKDFIDYMKAQGGEKSLSGDELHNMSSGLVLAGSETTASALSGMTYHLLKNPDKLARLQAEICSAFASSEDITMLKVDKLEYLHACLNESLRIYPPAPATFPRKVPLPGETIEGQWVPGGTSVGINHWTAYSSDANFKHAKEFHPERWMDRSEWASPDEFAADSHEIFQPFSFGPRNCIGRNLAWAEMRLITAHLMYSFDLALAPGMDGWTEQNVFLVWAKKPLMVSLRPKSM